MKLKLWMLLILIGAVFFGCDKSLIKSSDKIIPIKDTVPLKNEGVSKLMEQVMFINNNSPSSISASFYIEGLINKKKYKTMGDALFNKEARQMNIVFFDLIFKSPLTRVFQNKDVINIYFPVEKNLFVDNFETINLSNYTNVNIDFNIIYKLAVGEIPLIDNYKIRQGLSANNGKSSYLILENKKYFETISFENNIPNKILIMDKKSRERFEIYLDKIIKTGNSCYYKSISVIANNGAVKVYFNFNKVSLNGPVKILTIDDIKLPKDVKVTRM